MERLLTIFFFGLIFSSCLGPITEEYSQSKGYPVSMDHASAQIMLRPAQPAQKDIENYMAKVFPTWGERPQTKSALALAIRLVAIDFDIDARILTALISHESAFDARAVSPTGAVGLTQLTISGTNEFLDQSGVIYEDLGNKTYAGAGSAYFQTAIKKHWPKFPTGKILKNFDARTAWAKSSKEQVFSRSDQYVAQIIAGATILKAATAYACFQSSSCTAAKLNTTSDDTLSIRVDIVRAGLEKYNGDDQVRPDGEITKAYYAKDILKRIDQI